MNTSNGDLISRLVDALGDHRKRVVVIGDAMNDHWINGRVGVCQDGCPKFTTESIVSVPGGAANAYQCLKHWSVKSDLFSYPKNVWPSKHRFVQDGKIVFRFDDECALRSADHLSSAWQYRTKLAIDMAACADAVLLSDYDKGFLSHDIIAKIVEVCNRRGVPCVADCKRAPEVYAGCILKANGLWSSQHERGAAHVVTWGAGSPVVNGIERRRLPSVELTNHVGAGDCFAAHLVLALAGGLSLEDAAAVAHSAGRVYVQYVLNRAPHPDEVAADMDTN